MRVNAWVGGGALPPAVRGTKLAGLGGIEDWYATFADIANAGDITDHEAAAAGLPPVDSLSLWPCVPAARTPTALRVTSELRARARRYVSGGARSSPRSQLILGTGDGGVDGIIVDKGAAGLWKRLEGNQHYAGWTAPAWPNATAHHTPDAADCSPFCLFRLDTDPHERADLQPNASSGAAAAIAQELAEKMVAARATGFHPVRGPQDPQACVTGMAKYGGYWGPWVGVEQA